MVVIGGSWRSFIVLGVFLCFFCGFLTTFGNSWWLLEVLGGSCWFWGVLGAYWVFEVVFL